MKTVSELSLAQLALPCWSKEVKEQSRLEAIESLPTLDQFISAYTPTRSAALEKLGDTLGKNVTEETPVQSLNTSFDL
jgi:hypothetical protein